MNLELIYSFMAAQVALSCISLIVGVVIACAIVFFRQRRSKKRP